MGSSRAEEKAEADMVRQAKTEDLVIVAGLAVQMWKEPSMQELIEEFSEIMLKNDGVFSLNMTRSSLSGLHNANCGMIMWREPIPHRWGIWKASLCMRNSVVKVMQRNC